MNYFSLFFKKCLLFGIFLIISNLLDAQISLCDSVDITSASNSGNFNVDNYSENDGIRNGPDYFGSTIFYPKNTNHLLPSIIIIPGYANPEASMQAWGPFLASHGIVTMTIGTNNIFQYPNARKDALLDALISIKQENSRAASPLYNKLDVNKLALAGWSMGGGGAQLAAVEDSSLKAIVALCPWLDPNTTNSSTVNHNIPIIFVSSELDAIAPPSSHADMQYQLTPSSTKKLIYEINNAGHTAANNPLNSQGDVGRMVLSWLKNYLEDDSCYCPLLLDIPNSASRHETNINCQTNNISENSIALILYPNPTKNIINIEAKSWINTEYKILDLNGKIVYKGSINNDLIIDISFLESNIYFICLNNKYYKILKI